MSEARIRFYGTGPRIIVRDNGRFTDVTEQGEPIQYAPSLESPDGLALRTLPREQWDDDPIVMDVTSWSGTSATRARMRR